MSVTNFLLQNKSSVDWLSKSITFLMLRALFLIFKLAKFISDFSPISLGVATPAISYP